MIGSHNTMSYLPVKHWWMRPFRFIGKCQNKDIKEQIEAGIKAFDIRIHFDNKTNKFEFGHGLLDVKSDFTIYSLINFIETNCQNPTIRLILEKGTELHKVLFKNLCNEVEGLYSKVTFYGGNYKPTWEKLYTFKTDNNQEADTVQYVSSMASDVRWYEKFIPILYAKRMNKENLSKITNYKINLFDFV